MTAMIFVRRVLRRWLNRKQKGARLGVLGGKGFFTVAKVTLHPTKRVFQAFYWPHAYFLNVPSPTSLVNLRCGQSSNQRTRGRYGAASCRTKRQNKRKKQAEQGDRMGCWGLSIIWCRANLRFQRKPQRNGNSPWNSAVQAPSEYFVEPWGQTPVSTAYP
jgi:hypothetical protein